VHIDERTITHEQVLRSGFMKRILVGLDGSPRAAAVLTTAITIGKAQGAKLALVRSIGLPPDVPQDFWKTTEEPLIDILKRHAQEYLAEQAARIPAGLVDRSEVVVAVPWQGICETAKALRADLIVIGSHGFSGVDRLLGTTAAKVVNHAPCSVVVVREPHPEETR
jgi:nucleotide-binding universal stress UspA family protein